MAIRHLVMQVVLMVRFVLFNNIAGLFDVEQQIVFSTIADKEAPDSGDVEGIVDIDFTAQNASGGDAYNDGAGNSTQQHKHSSLTMRPVGLQASGWGLRRRRWDYHSKYWCFCNRRS